MDIRPNRAPWQTAERQARFTSAFVESTIGTSSALMAVLSVFHQRDPDAWAHACHVAAIAVRIGTELGLGARALGDIERAAWLHDLGRFVTPDPEATEPRAESLEASRGDQLRAVYEMTTAVPFLAPAGELVIASREQFDGSGPGSLARESIPLGARILHLADVLDAVACLPLRVTLNTLNAELVRHAGSRFDPDVVAAWLRCSDDTPTGLVPWLSSLARRTGASKCS